MVIPQSRRLDFSEIPVIDLAALVAGDNDSATVDAISAACKDVGFFYVKNHGFALSLIDELLAGAEDFFSQPMDVKKKIIINERIRGYLPLRYRSYEGEVKAATSNQEGFWIGEERAINEMNRLDAATQLSVVLQKAFSLALGQREDYFEKLFTRQSSMLKLNHYPPQENPTRVSNIGVVPHTDSGGFTILWQDNNGGLEIQSKCGEWVLAPPNPETFVINIGNTMKIWTNGVFSSTPHRVINRSGKNRYSIPFFVNPRWDVPVRPIIGDNVTESGQQNFESYQLEKWRRAFPIAGIKV